MRTLEEIERRVRDWEQARGQFFPDPFFAAVLNPFSEYLSSWTEPSATAEAAEAIFWGEFEAAKADLEAGKSYIKMDLDKMRDYLSVLLAREAGWIAGRNDAGAFKAAVWNLLVCELHDAECAMKWDGTDIVLEGKGGPPDFTHEGRTFQFWLRFKEARFADERLSRPPIEVIWLLDGEVVGNRFVLSAQDDTFSGLLTFSGIDFDCRMWNHVKPSR